MPEEAIKFYSIFVTILISYSYITSYCLVSAKPSQEYPPTKRQSPFLGAFIFPHGGITLDPFTRDFMEEPGGLPTSQQQAIRLHNAMRTAAQELVKTKPDLIILSTPHGFYLDEHYVLINSPTMAGTAGWSWDNFTAKFTVAKSESVKLYIELRGANDPVAVELLSLGVGQSPLPLHWGEVIPWWFINQAAIEIGFELPPVIYIGQSPTKSLPVLLKLGADIVKICTNVPELSEKRIAIVISGDLAHTHSNDPKAPYGFSASASVFDLYIKQWGMMDRNSRTELESSDILLTKAEEITDPAGSCGFNGFVMLHGMLTQLVQNGVNLRAQFYEYAAPTYFGMIVTSWLPE